MKSFIELITAKPDAPQIEEKLVIFDKLSIATINIMNGIQIKQDELRDLQIFYSVVPFLQISIQNQNKTKAYNEETIISTLNFLIKAVDSNKQNQELVIKCFKTYEIVL